MSNGLKAQVIKPPKDHLQDLLTAKTQNQIADLYEVKRGTIHRWLNMDGILKIRLPKSIPTEVFAPILQELLDGWEMFPLQSRVGEGRVNSKKRGAKFSTSGKLGIISSVMPPELKVPERRFRAILMKEQVGITWNTVDKLLCFFGRPDLWYSAELLPYYFEGKGVPDSAAIRMARAIGARER